MSGMNDIQLQLDEIRKRLDSIESYLQEEDSEPVLPKVHWAFEDPEADNKWRV